MQRYYNFFILPLSANKLFAKLPLIKQIGSKMLSQSIKQKQTSNKQKLYSSLLRYKLRGLNKAKFKASMPKQTYASEQISLPEQQSMVEPRSSKAKPKAKNSYFTEGNKPVLCWFAKLNKEQLNIVVIGKSLSAPKSGLIKLLKSCFRHNIFTVITNSANKPPDNIPSYKSCYA